ncbi:SURF1 family protein [Maricurvus nonylphenolicus]|uniref:SURF1 family protein n=1 Tax=Maricurvus nonylphenolicus TaxID=1008307 RepID=UPI0036F244E9
MQSSNNANGSNTEYCEKQYPNTFQLTPNWKLSVFAVLFLPLFISLGFWQLNRADEKQEFLDAFNHQQQLPAMSLGEYVAIKEPQPYRQLTLQGKYDQQRYWLLENQVQQGRQGYRVIVPLSAVDGEAYKTVLVDLMWVMAPPRREQLPQVTIPKTARISGYLKQPGDNPLLTYLPETDSWPQRVVELDIDAMADQLGVEVLPGVLHQQQGVAPVNTTPEKHQGYAWQWFAMAIALAMATLIANTNITSLLRKHSNNASTHVNSL